MGAGVSLRWVSFECTLRLNENVSVSQSNFLTSYLHHSYPYSPATFGSDAAYGSMKRLASSTVASTDGSAQSISYSALFGEVYSVIPVYQYASDGYQVIATFSCIASSCLPNDYKADGKCNRCPIDHRSNTGATSISQCWACPAGTYLSHPHATDCSIANQLREDVLG